MTKTVIIHSASRGSSCNCGLFHPHFQASNLWAQTSNHGKDWFRAESELIRYVPVEIKDTAENIVVHAEVPGFNTNDIKISVDGRQLMLSGKVEATTEEKSAQTVYNERRSNQFYRAMTLPTDVDATKAIASMKDGVLELTLSSFAKKLAAQEAAHRVTGVLDAANDIKVKSPGGLMRDDAEIARAVRHALE